jgi:Rrf2 family protein
VKFLESILAELKRAGIVRSQRGSEGGYWLARPAGEVSIADIIRAVEGPLADVRGVRPESLEYADGLEALQRMWVALRASLRGVLEQVTLADLRDGRLPGEVEALADDPSAWAVH